MNQARLSYRNFTLGALIFLTVGILGFGITGCQTDEPTANINSDQPAEYQQATQTPPSTSLDARQETRSAITTEVVEVNPGRGSLHFLPPSVDPATPIPPVHPELGLSDEILVWVLLGSDTEPPFTGRTQAIHLLFINPRFSKASLVSIPGDLYVYIPGFAMQRINTAYALGGIKTLRETLAYNFGVIPERFVLAHPGDFQWLVDDIGTIDVTVFYPMPQVCGGIPAGLVRMDGPLALCYASYRNGIDEMDRLRRQQQVMRVIFRKLTRDGNLIQLPVLYTSYEGWVKTDLSLSELMSNIPLALRLADTDRIGYFMIGWDQVTLWEVPGFSQAQVFLPKPEAVDQIFQQAVNSIMVPQPQTNLVQTLEAQLSLAYQGTVFPTPTLFVTPTITGTLGTPTPTPTTTPIPPGYP